MNNKCAIFCFLQAALGGCRLGLSLARTCAGALHLDADTEARASKFSPSATNADGTRAEESPDKARARARSNSVASSADGSGMAMQVRQSHAVCFPTPPVRRLASPSQRAASGNILRTVVFRCSAG